MSIKVISLNIYKVFSTQILLGWFEGIEDEAKGTLLCRMYCNSLDSTVNESIP